MRSPNSNLMLGLPCRARIPGKGTRPVFWQTGSAYSASASDKGLVLNPKVALSHYKASFFFAWQPYTYLAAAVLLHMGKELTHSQELSHWPSLPLPVASNCLTQPTPMLSRPVCVYSISPSLKNMLIRLLWNWLQRWIIKKISRSRQGYHLPWE